MIKKHVSFASFIAFFMFIMMSIVVNHPATFGQIPTPDLSPIPEPTPPAIGVVTGTVNASDGTAIADAVVSTDTGASTVTDPTGSYALELPPGNYLLTASATGFIPSSQPAEVVAGAPTFVNFVLQPEPTGGSGIVFGFVSDPDDEPLTGVTVTITGTDTGTEFSASTATDEEGFYLFENLAPGDYTLTYEKDGYQTQEEEISLEENEPPLDLGTVIMEEVVKAKISGYIYDIEGEPLEKVRLKIKGIKTPYNDTESSDAEGFFEFTDLDANTFVITAKKRGFRNAKKTVKLEDEEEREIEIEMKKSTKRVIKASAR